MRCALAAALCFSCGRVQFRSVDDAAIDAPPPAIATVQAGASTTNTAIGSLTLTDPVQQHDAIIACFTITSGSATLQSIADSLGNTYSIVAGPVVTNGYDHYIALAANSAAGSDTLTVTLSAAAGGWDLLALEYSGLALTDPLDATTYDSGNSGDMSSGATSTSVPHELLLAYGHSTGMMAGPGFTERNRTAQNLVFDQEVFTADSYTATGTTIPGIWTLMLATFAGQ